MQTIFDTCVPRADVAAGRVRDGSLRRASAIVMGLRQRSIPTQRLFFAHTYPTRGLKTLLETVCRRLSDTGGELNSVLGLDTQYGGGKTHSLIALVHAVRGMKGVADAWRNSGCQHPSQGECGSALDGENSEPANGLKLEDGLYARSISRALPYRLAGRDGYERIRTSDERHIAPGTGADC